VVRRDALALAVSIVGLTSSVGRAGDPPPSAERLRSAAEEYDKGRRYYQAGDYEQAAIHFENAYTDAPRAEPLRNAIRSRRLAKQLARAATLASLAASRYENDAATMSLVQEVLAEAGPKLYLAAIHCKPECSVAVDGRVVSLSDAAEVKVYVEPGQHALVVSWPGDRTKQGKIDASAGGRGDLRFEAPPPRPSTTGPGGATTPDTAGPTSSPKPLAPIVFFVGAGLTVAGAIATAVSGIDAKNNPGEDAVRRDCVGQGESCPTYQQGKDAETRTNVLLAVTGGLAVATAVVGLFFTQWGPSPARRGSREPLAGERNERPGPELAPRLGFDAHGASVGLSGRF
jgi:hypothetical protein